jgi:hypothetical protein
MASMENKHHKIYLMVAIMIMTAPKKTMTTIIETTSPMIKLLIPMTNEKNVFDSNTMVCVH